MKPSRMIGTGLAVFLGVVVALLVVRLLPDSLNPFSQRTVDRSPPPVLQSIEDIGEYRASSANLQLVLDLEKDTRFVPSVIKGERVLFVAAGRVDAGVDFRALGPDSVTVSADRKSVTITLPAPKLYPPEVDNEKTAVVNRDRGVLDRIGSVFSSPDDAQEMYKLADQRLAEAAAADPRVLEQARTNTRSMLTALLQSLGFEHITITFAPPPAQ
ncbi:MAG: DUF4230 domain-containing protein [Thermoleophilia bacterium]|nr:DUF4230 domain-containing protein [Thermoleophilia bacterium]